MHSNLRVNLLAIFGPIATRIEKREFGSYLQRGIKAHEDGRLGGAWAETTDPGSFVPLVLGTFAKENM